MISSARLTTILNTANLGDPEEAELMMPLVYDELRALARQQLRGERPGHCAPRRWCTRRTCVWPMPARCR